MEIRMEDKIIKWNEGEYFSVGYDTENLFVSLIKGDIRKGARNQPICKLEDIAMAHDLSMSIYLAKQENVPVFDVEQWISEYKQFSKKEL